MKVPKDGADLLPALEDRDLISMKIRRTHSSYHMQAQKGKIGSFIIWIMCLYTDSVLSSGLMADLREAAVSLSLLESIQLVANTDKEVRRMEKNRKQRVTSSFSHLRTADKS